MDNMGNAEVTMEKLMEEFEIYLGNKAERTKKLYMENMRQFDFSDLPTKRHIARKTNEWLDNGLSYNTILARYSALKKFLHTFSRYFSAEDIKDMISYMGELKGYTPETIYAKPEQVERIIKTAEHREALAVALMFYMGMRISDVVALRMEQFKRDKAGNVFLKYRDKKTKKLHEVQLFENVGSTCLSVKKENSRHDGFRSRSRSYASTVAFPICIAIRSVTDAAQLTQRLAHRQT